MFRNYLDETIFIKLKEKEYYFIWVERFLLEIDINKKTNTLNYSDIFNFLTNLLEKENIKSWQILQAGDAISLFINMLTLNNGDKLK